MHRPTVGILAAILLAIGGALWLSAGENDTAAAWIAGCWRVGLALAALWLALPDMRRIPAWLIALILFAALLVARQPRVMLIAFAAAVAFAVLRPLVLRATSTPRR